MKVGGIWTNSSSDELLFNLVKPQARVKLPKGGQLTGDFKSKNIIEWLQMHLKQITTLNTVQETEEFIRSNEKVLIGFFKDDKSEESQNYMEIATNFNNPTFAIVKNEEIFNVFHATDQSVILFNKLNDNSQIKFTRNLTLNNMKNFLDIYLRPVIVDLSSDAVSDVIFELPNILKYVIIFASKNDTNETNSVLQSAKIVAEEYRNQIRFVLVDVDKDTLSSILEPFHISFNEIPGILFVSNIFKSTSSRYKITGNLSLKNIRSFVKYCNDDTIDDLLDEKLPEDWNKRAVYKLVKSNFLNVTHDFEKDVLVYMYVDNCNKCVKWENVIEDVAKTLANRGNTIISKINIGLNGIDDKWYESTPSIVLFRKGDNKSVRYEGKANVEDIVRFIETVNIM
ncbi:hypothetical protein FQR65_LT08277 [Abscondita terminalis]|nr:hypothetical protein FQR65_LT08277 [Abscondita terminalis]